MPEKELRDAALNTRAGRRLAKKWGHDHYKSCCDVATCLLHGAAWDVSGQPRVDDIVRVDPRSVALLADVLCIGVLTVSKKHHDYIHSIDNDEISPTERANIPF